MKLAKESLKEYRRFFFLLLVSVLLKTFSCDIIVNNGFIVHKCMQMPILTGIELRI